MGLRKDPPEIAEANVPGKWVSVVAFLNTQPDMAATIIRRHDSWAEAWGRLVEELEGAYDEPPLPEAIVGQLNAARTYREVWSLLVDINENGMTGSTESFDLVFVPYP